MFGGPIMSPGDVEALLGRCGFVDVRTLPGPPGSVIALIVGRKPPGA
jgi:hypothetical protein